MAIEDYIPNVFGNVPQVYQGLLGADETAALQKRSNLQGLLGAAVALAQGMSPQGARRSAAQNILTALGQGFGASNEAMAQGLRNYQTRIELTNQTAKANVMNKLRSGQQLTEQDLAILDPEKYAQRKMYEQMVADEMKMVPQPASQVTVGEVPPPGAPATVVAPQSAEADALERDIRRLMASANVSSRMGDATSANNYIAAAERLRDRQSNLLASSVDIQERINAAPEQFREQYRTIAQLAKTGALKGNQILDSIRAVDASVVEFQKGNKLEGATADYSQFMFGTTDRTKLTRDQLANVLAYQNAPADKDRAQIANDAMRLRFETGQGGVVPKGRSEFLGGIQQPAAQMPSTPAIQPAQVPRAVQQPAVPSQAAPAAVAPQTAAPQPAAAKVPTIKPTEVPLIQQPDSVVPIKKKQELIAAKQPTVSLVNYSLKNIVDSRDAAKKILDNPGYIDALTGITAPAMASIPGTDAYTANELLKNLLSRAFITEIQSMRAASPTGGAVGSVAVAEMDSLSKIQASLTLGMKKDEFKKQLQQYVNNAERAIKTIPKEFANTYGYTGEFDEILRGGVVEAGTGTIIDKQSVDEELRRRKGNKGGR